MSDNYIDLFSDWKSIQSNFSMHEPEPEEVLLAAYEYKDYSGYALVAFRNGTDYYLVDGSHCSCYGLEGQWEPEKYTKEKFIEAIGRRSGNWPKAILAKIKSATP